MKFLYLISIVIIFCCKTKTENISIVQKNIHFYPKFDNHGKYFLKDKDFKFSLEEVTENTYVARWGDNLKNVDSIKIYPDGNIKGFYNKKIGLYLTQGCGTACSFVNICLNKNNRILSYNNPVSINLEDSIIIYRGEETNSLLIVENLYTNKRIVFGALDLPKAYPGFVIDSIAILPAKKVFLKWENYQGNPMETLLSLKELSRK